MVSDGICGAGEDQWVKDKLAQFDRGQPKDLAVNSLPTALKRSPMTERLWSSALKSGQQAR